MEEETSEFTFNLTEKESQFLVAAVIDFFHKMRATAESQTYVFQSDTSYQTAKSLWSKVANEIEVY